MNGGVRERGSEPLEVRADCRMGAVQRGVEVAFSRHDMEELLLEFCRADRSVFGWAWLLLRSINEIIVRIGVSRIFLELRKEEVVATGGVTDAVDGRCAFVAAELLFPLFPDFGVRRL